MPEKVAIVKVQDNLYDAVHSAIELIGGINFQDHEKVAVKPNLSDLRSSEDGVTTSVELIEEIIRWIKEKAVEKITIVESNHWVATADEEFEKLGYAKLRDKYGVRLANISKEKKIEIMLNGFHIESLHVPKTLFECNKLISVAKLKTHSAYKMTCILKNQFGLVTKRYKSGYHVYMSEVLADLNRFYKPDLCIVDGIVALEGAGPTFGEPVETGIILCGKDALAVDLVAAKIMGFDPDGIPYLKFAMKKGISRVKSLQDVEIVGEKLVNVQRDFKFISRLNYGLIRFGYAIIRFGRSLSAALSRLGTLMATISGLASVGVRKTLHIAYGVVRKKIAGFLTKIRYSY